MLVSMLHVYQKHISTKHKAYLKLLLGQIVSVDMMESRLPGFIAQMKGKLTNKRYVGSILGLFHQKGRVW